MENEYRKAIQKFGKGVQDAGRMLGISRRQSTRFAAGFKLSAPVRKLLKVMEKYRIDPKEVEGF